MQRHSQILLSKIKLDRSKGLSISQLVSKYSIPKTTIWHHIRGVGMSEESRRLIKSYQGGRKLESQREWEKAREEASSFLRDFDEKFAWPVLLAALYWSEGTKKGGFVFTNTDESMIRVFLHVLRTYLKVRDEHLDILIRTYKPMSPFMCKKHWSLVTGIPVANVRINHNNRHNKSKTRYGMCRITLRKGGYRLKLMHCLIRNLVDKMAHAPKGSRSSTDRTSHS